MKKDKDRIEKLIIAGGLRLAGADKNGKPLYQFTDKMKRIDEALYNDHLNFVNSEIMKLWESGFVDMSLFDDEPRVTLTEKAFVPDDLAKLSKQQRWSLEEIKRIIRRRKV